MLCLSYYHLGVLFNKIEEEGRPDSAWKPGGWKREGGGGGQRGGMAQAIYTMNKQ
jgi:hypothetical protein